MIGIIAAYPLLCFKFIKHTEDTPFIFKD